MAEIPVITSTRDFHDAIFFLENHRDVKAFVDLEEAFALIDEKKIPIDLPCPQCKEKFSSVVSNHDLVDGKKLPNGTLQVSLGCQRNACVYKLHHKNLISYSVSHLKDAVIKQRKGWVEATVAWEKKDKETKKRKATVKKQKALKGIQNEKEGE